MNIAAARNSGERRWQLRERTAAVHAELDELVGGFDSLEAYRRYVVGTARFRLPIESQIQADALPGQLSGWQPSLLSPLISADLDDLGIEAPPTGDVAAPRNVHEWVGVLYVLEGSSLGARVLAKRAEAIGLGPAFGARHLFRQVKGAEHGWQPFLIAMERVSSLDIDIAAGAAILTFESAINAFRDAQRSD